MKLYCTFLFSHPSEFNLLIGKVLTEADYIDQWIIVESSYSFKGEYKGLALNKLLDHEPRLALHRDRIHVLEISDNLLESVYLGINAFSVLEIFVRKALKKSTQFSQRQLIERKFFEVEKLSRDFALSVLQQIATNQDWLFITDVDEVIDLHSDVTRTELMRTLKSTALFHQIQRRRYVFDFDNLDPRFRTVPLISFRLLEKDSGFRISNFRFMSNGVVSYFSKPPVIEFSYCFSIHSIMKKLDNFAHLSVPEQSIVRALRLNHQLLYPGDSENQVTWFQTDHQIENWIPKYFLENLSTLKTNIVDLNYESNRVEAFPRYFKKSKDKYK